jgi:anti-anti-sigma factor
MWARLQRFRVDVEDSDVTTVLRPTGRLDAANLPRLERFVPDTGDRDVVVDLGGLSYMDGAAWLWVLGLEERGRAWGRSFRLVNGLPAPRGPFRAR